MRKNSTGVSAWLPPHSHLVVRIAVRCIEKYQVEIRSELLIKASDATAISRGTAPTAQRHTVPLLLFALKTALCAAESRRSIGVIHSLHSMGCLLYTSDAADEEDR